MSGNELQVPPNVFTTNWAPGDDVAFATKGGVMRGQVVCVQINQRLDTTVKTAARIEAPRVSYVLRVKQPGGNYTNHQALEQHMATTLDDAWKSIHAQDLLE